MVSKRNLCLFSLTAALAFALASAAEPAADNRKSLQAPTQPGSTKDQAKVPAESLAIGDQRFQLEVAADDESRAKGLMERESIEEGKGMLFIFPDCERRNVWMKNCLTDMDLIFLDATGRIVATHEMKIEPPRWQGETEKQYEARLKTYPSRRPAQFAIELRAGKIKELKLKPGDAIVMDVERLKKLATSAEPALPG